MRKIFSRGQGVPENAQLRKQLKEDKIRALNADLERRVAERTRELEETNRRLEQEIAERTHAEQALRKSQAILAQAGQMAHLGAWEIEFKDWEDINSNPLHWSEETFRIFGYVPGTVSVTNDLFFQHVHPDDRARVAGAVAQAIAERRSYSVEHRILRPDGEERMVLEHADIIFDDQGRPLQMIGAVQDITERTEDGRVLQESEARFRTVLENSMDVAYRRNLATDRYDYLSPVIQQLTGFPSEEFIGLSLDQVLARIHPEDLPQVEEAIEQTLTGEKPSATVEYRLRGKDGEYRWLADNFKVLKDVRGCPAYRVGIIRDVHERKQADERIQKLNRALEQRAMDLEIANRELEAFSYSVSHDLRTPLASIDAFTRLVLQEYGSELGPAAARYLHLVHENAVAMTRLIEDLLVLSRSSRQSLKKQTVAPNELAEEVLGELRSGQNGRRIEFVVKEMPTCQADPRLLKQVYTNLISNAIKFTRKRDIARIELGFRAGVDEPAFYVKDNGVGFDMNTAERLFGVFQRFHSEEEYEGTGVGLAIVERIVRRHGGRIWAEAQVDHGATFYFTLG